MFGQRQTLLSVQGVAQPRYDLSNPQRRSGRYLHALCVRRASDRNSRGTSAVICAACAPPGRTAVAVVASGYICVIADLRCRVGGVVAGERERSAWMLDAPARADLEEEGTVDTVLLRAEDGRQVLSHGAPPLGAAQSLVCQKKTSAAPAAHMGGSPATAPVKSKKAFKASDLRNATLPEALASVDFGPVRPLLDCTCPPSAGETGGARHTRAHGMNGHADPKILS